MAAFNRVILVGNLTRDPELKYTPSGQQLAKFGLAVSRSFSKTNETDFFNIVAWGKLAEICGQYLHKGKQVLIEGEIHTRTYETQEGQKRSAVDIRANNMLMLGSRKDSEGYSKGSSASGGYGSAPSGSSSSRVEELDVNDLGVDEFDAEDMPF